MIKHIVLFKLNEFESAKVKEAKKDEIKVALEKLPSLISEIKKFSVEVNINGLAKSSELAIVSEFESLETLDRYRVHPEHVKVVDLIRANCLPSTSIDYEF